MLPCTDSPVAISLLSSLSLSAPLQWPTSGYTSMDRNSEDPAAPTLKTEALAGGSFQSEKPGDQATGREERSFPKAGLVARPYEWKLRDASTRNAPRRRPRI